MDPFVVSLSLPLFLLALYLIFYYPTITRRRNLPPGPTAYPIIGNLIWFRFYLADAESTIRNFQHKYGKIITLHLGPQPLIIVFDRNLAHKFLIQHGSVFASRPFVQANEADTIKLIRNEGYNISTTVYGPIWRLLRRNLVSEILHPSRIKTYSDARSWVLGIVLDKIWKQSEGGSAGAIFVLPGHPPPSSIKSTANATATVFKPSSSIPLLLFQRKSFASITTSFLCFIDRGGGGFTPIQSTLLESDHKDEKRDPDQCNAMLKGGEQVTSVLEEMIALLEDMEMDKDSEAAAVELAAQGVIGKRVDEMESGFMMALDYMIQLAEKDQDDQRKSLLEIIKQTVLDHLTKKCPPHVQVIGLLCRTPKKESRQELLRRVAAGGGVFKGEQGTKVQLPGANLNDIANQADDLLETMESRPTVPDRKLLARLVLIREEARDMMGGGILDERNDRGLSTLPEAEVNFLAKLVAIKPGKTLQTMIKSVMQGKGDGADDQGEGGDHPSGGIAGRGSVTGHKPRPVRPGMFLETVSKVLGGVYSGNSSGITAQHLEWVHRKTLEILQELAF